LQVSTDEYKYPIKISIDEKLRQCPLGRNPEGLVNNAGLKKADGMKKRQAHHSLYLQA
jgi:hypothetical protein